MLPTLDKGGELLPRRGAMCKSYLEVIWLIERVHRQFLEIVTLELDGLGIRDINRARVDAVNILAAEMSVGEPIGRVRYLTSNPWYNDAYEDRAIVAE